MRPKRYVNSISSSSEALEGENVSKRPRGRPCKLRFQSIDFPLKAQGKPSGPKRTPIHLGDPFAHREEYQVEEIMAECFRLGEEHFKVNFLSISYFPLNFVK